MKKSILIIGGTGYIGNYLVKLFFNKGYKVIATYNNKTVKNKKIKYVKCDIGKENSVKRIFEKNKYDIVINTATSFDPSNHDLNSISKSFTTNITGHNNLIKYSEKIGVKLFIYLSSISVYEGIKNDKNGFNEDMRCHPKMLYSSSKVYAENLLKHYCNCSKMNGLVLRISGVHGQGRKSGFIYNFINNALNNKKIKINEPTSKFRITFLDDLGKAMLSILKKKKFNKFDIFNLASESQFNLKQVAKLIISISKSGKLIEKKIFTERNQVMNITKFKNTFPYKGQTLKENLNNLINFHFNNK